MGTDTDSGGVGIRSMDVDVWGNVVIVAVGWCETPMVVNNWVLGTRPAEILLTPVPELCCCCCCCVLGP